MTNPQYNPYGSQQPSYPTSYPPQTAPRVAGPQGQQGPQPASYPLSYPSPSTPLYPPSGQLPPQQQYGQQPVYSQPLYAQPMVMPMVMRPMTATNGMATASLICSLIGLFTADFLVIPGVLAVIFGHIALGQIKKSNGQQTGQGMAIAGLIIGYLQVAPLVFFCILLLIGLIGSAGSGG
ncbi:MAG: DUF4190 domain-containing protein [Ktedonobacterales bacterium]